MEIGIEGGHDWYKFKRGENMSGSVGVESLKVNSEVITKKEGIRKDGIDIDKWNDNDNNAGKDDTGKLNEKYILDYMKLDYSST
ncbi:hypothetical protein E2C01_011832 [Portunus trituberculatus]|uniref:Uncharacterized protein n=1 Tax=Portunus trituberculatus TaxID=210409 RepID=A0A5B7DC85_PORTR|nr:hypothetical protein [Portunus trituberculatus]